MKEIYKKGGVDSHAHEMLRSDRQTDRQIKSALLSYNQIVFLNV